MRRHTITALCLSALAVPALAGCSTGSSASAGKASSATTQAHRAAKGAAVSALLSPAELSKRLLDESDLGEGYTRKPQQPQRHDDVAVSGCPALDRLGGDVAVGGSLAFPRKAKASFAYEGGSDSELAEELYSGTEDNLSKGVGQIFEAMTSCPTYQVLVGATPITVTTRKLPAPKLGDERWSQLLTFTVGGRGSVVKQTVVRTGTVVVVVSGSAALVDAHLAKAVDKAHGAP